MFVIPYRKILLGIAAVVMTGSILIVATLGLNLGIDFTGGSLTEVAYITAPEKEVVENAVNEAALGEFSVRQSIDEAGRPAFLAALLSL